MLNDLRELVRYRELFVTLVARDLKGRYKRSALGFVWSLANPLIQIATLTIVFKYMVMRTPMPNYSAFLFVGFIPWMFLQLALTDASVAVPINVQILKRVYFPREILPLSNVASNLVHFLLALVVLFGYLIVCRIGFSWSHLLYLPLIILLQTIVVSGLALLISCASVYFADITYLVTAGLNLLYWGSCIMYPLEKSGEMPGLAGSKFAWVAYVNPVIPLITLYRRVLLARTELPDGGGQPVGWDLLLPVILFAVLSFVVGYTVFNWRKWEFAERT